MKLKTKNKIISVIGPKPQNLKPCKLKPCSGPLDLVSSTADHK